MKRFSTILIAIVGFGIGANAQNAQQDNREKIREYIVQARTAYDAGEFGDALAEYQSALELSPQNPELCKAIGGVYEKLGGTANLIEAKANYERYLELAPKAEDGRAIQDKIYALKYQIGKSQKMDYILDDLSGTWVAKDNLEVVDYNDFSYYSDFTFDISEIQKTGKYRVTIKPKGSRYYSETIIDKTVNITPQKDLSFNFTFADAKVHTPNQANYDAVRAFGGALSNATGKSWVSDAVNAATDAVQANDLPSNTQTAYMFALKYDDGKLKGAVNVVQKFADPNQQKTTENGLYEITFIKKDAVFDDIKEKKDSIDSKGDIISIQRGGLYLDKYGKRLTKRDVKNKLMSFDPELGKSYQRALIPKRILGWTMVVAGSAGFVGGFVMIANATTYDANNNEITNKQKLSTGIWLAVGGGLMGCMSPAAFGTHSARANRAVNNYNDQVIHSHSKPTSQLQFGISPFGVGLALKF